MGQDLCLAAFRLPVNSRGETLDHPDLWDDRCQTELKRRIEKEGITLDDWDYAGFMDEDENINFVILDAYEELIKGIRAGWRDLALMKFDDKDRWWVLSGGMTWGDDPSDSFDLISHLANVQKLFDEPFAALQQGTV